jgi:hypothetical protein
MRTKRRCRNCPENPEPVKPEPVAPASFMETESKRLWQQAIMGCNTLIDMLGNYATIGVPGAPVAQLQRLTVKLQTIIETCEVQHADFSPAK